MERKNSYTISAIADAVLKTSFRDIEPNGIKTVQRQVTNCVKKYEVLLDTHFKTNLECSNSEYIIPYTLGVLVYLEVKVANPKDPPPAHKNFDYSQLRVPNPRRKILDCIKNNTWSNFDVNQLASFFVLYYSYDGWTDDIKPFLEQHRLVTETFIKHYNNTISTLLPEEKKKWLSTYTKVLITSFNNFSELEIFDELF